MITTKGKTSLQIRNLISTIVVGSILGLICICEISTHVVVYVAGKTIHNLLICCKQIK